VGNVFLAHVPDVNDFVAGMKILLKPNGILQWSFPTCCSLFSKISLTRFIMSIFLFSFLTVTKIFAAHGLTLFDVEEIPTHGGSLRIYGKHDNADPIISARVTPVER